MAKIQPLIRPGFSQLLKRFPEYHDAVCILLMKNRLFNEICLDYEQCCKALRRWQTQNSEESKLRTAEYEEILHDLDQEILQYLIEYDADSRVAKKQ